MSSCEALEPMIQSGTALGSWYAVHTRSRHEKRIAGELQSRGVTTFLPLVTEMHKWSDRSKKVEVPLFSCYVFVNLAESLEERVTVLRTSGVVSLLGGNHQGTSIPESQIASIQTVVARKVPFSSHSYLEIG